MSTATPTSVSIPEALQILRDRTSIDYSYYRGVNGMVLSHVRDDGYSVETPCGSLAIAIYRETGMNVEIDE